MTSAYEAAGGDRAIIILRHRIETALGAVGPVGRDTDLNHLDNFNPWLAQIAQCRAEIARIEGLRNPANPNHSGDNL